MCVRARVCSMCVTAVDVVVCLFVCVCVCVRACVRACVRVCVRARADARAYASNLVCLCFCHALYENVC